jgi:hypothetical protein
MMNRRDFEREYLCEWVREPEVNYLADMLKDLYLRDAMVHSIIDYIRFEDMDKKEQPYKITVENIIQNNLYKICYEIIKIWDGKIGHMRKTLENQTAREISYYWDKSL